MPRRSISHVVDSIRTMEVNLGLRASRNNFVWTNSTGRTSPTPRDLALVLTGRAVISPAELCATRIVVKNNILAMYPALGVVMKIFESDDARTRHLTGQDRTYFEHLNVPTVFASGAEPLPHVVEQLIEGHPLRTEELARDVGQYIEDLVSMHSVAPACATLGVSDREVADAVSRLGEAGIRLTPAAHSWLASGSRNHCVRSGQVHGDLSPGNVLVSSVGWFLLDWEHAGAGPVAYDVRHLARASPAVERAYSVLLTQPCREHASEARGFWREVATAAIFELVRGPVSAVYFENAGAGVAEYNAHLATTAFFIEHAARSRGDRGRPTDLS